MSSAQLRKKNRCCKSTCLHCPYGHTIKKLGIQFRDAQAADQDFLELIGCDQSLENMSIAILKEHDFAAFTKNHIIITKLWLHPDFTDQEISKELLESYYFY